MAKLKRPSATKPGPKVYYGEKGYRFVRLWETLMVVVEAEQPLTVAEINERVCVNAGLREFAGRLNTTRDDLWVLVRCAFPVAMVDEEDEEVDLAEYMDPDKSRRGVSVPA